MKKFNYENKQYLKKLDELDTGYYSKYIRYVEVYLKSKNARVLDVGCGNGVVLEILKKRGYKNGYGVDVSKLFIKEGKKRGISNLYHYNGKHLPFNNKFFDVIGSFNVLEHTEEPEKFLQEQVTKLKNGGVLIVACPNFLSVLHPSYHHRLRGGRNKIKNLARIIMKLFGPKTHKFQKMEPIIRKKFQYDDDAIVITNIIDLKNTLNNFGCEIVYESGFINYDRRIHETVNSIPFIKYLLPSCFVVAQKT